MLPAPDIGDVLPLLQALIYVLGHRMESYGSMIPGLLVARQGNREIAPTGVFCCMERFVRLLLK